MKMETSTEALKYYLNHEQIEQVNYFRYLGTIFSDYGMLKFGIDRLSKAGSVGSQLNKFIYDEKELNQNTKLAVYNTVFKPILIYTVYID